MESGLISTILDAHLEHALPGTASPRCGDSMAHPADGIRRLGSTANPRGAHEAWVHRVRGDGIASHPGPACRARPSQALGRILAQPQGRHRRDGFVHGADRVASAAVRLLRYRARPSPYRSLQRDISPDLPLGSSSNYVRRFPTTRHRDSSSLTETQSLASPWSSSSRRWAQSRSAFPFAVLGRTEPPSAGSAAVGASSSGTSWSSASAIWSGL